MPIKTNEVYIQRESKACFYERTNPFQDALNSYELRLNIVN